MEFGTLLVLSVGLSMDTLALSLSCGLRPAQSKICTALKVAGIFGLIQALFPFVGWIAGSQLYRFIFQIDHWIAFGILLFIGGKMIWEAGPGMFRKKTPILPSKPSLIIANPLANDSSLDLRSSVPECDDSAVKPLTIGLIVTMGIASSIDAFAVGITFAFLPISILLAISIIGLTTFVVALLGFFVGNKVSAWFKHGVEIFGGLILIVIGVKILIEHLMGG